MKSNTAFNNYHLDKFVQLALTRISPEYLHLLTEDDRRHIAKKELFIRKGSLEDKLMLLAKIGYPFVITVADSKRRYLSSYVERIVKVFFKALTFHPKPAKFILKDHAFFFLSDLDIVRSLMLTTNLHTLSVDAYINTSSKAHQVQQTDKVTKNLATIHDLDNVVTKSIRLGASAAHQDQFFATYRIDFKKFLILAYLSRSREASTAAIKQNIGLHIRSELTELVQDKMIESRRTIAQTNYKEQMTYWLTGYGELVLMKARNYFI